MVRDVVTNFFRQIGMVGAIVLVSALIFGAVAGGVIVHRLDTTSIASSEQDREAEAGDKAEKADQGDKANGHGQAMKKKHANKAPKSSSKTEDAQEVD